MKGLGATVRLVMLPKESHGYRSKESIFHVLWEQDKWLDKYVMNKEKWFLSLYLFYYCYGVFLVLFLEVNLER